MDSSNWSTITDTLTNLVANLGTDKDKARHSFHQYDHLTHEHMRSIYVGSGLARKVIDIPVDDMTRAWRTWKAPNKITNALKKEEKRLKVKQQFNAALKLAALTGGAAIYMGTDDNDLTTELLPENVSKGGIKYLHVLSRFEITAMNLILNPTMKDYGSPEFYYLCTPTFFAELPSFAKDKLKLRQARTLDAKNGGELIAIHPSRILRFVGNPELEVQYSWRSEGWGTSKLLACWTEIRNAETALAAMASLIPEAKVDIYKIPELTVKSADPTWSAQLISRVNLASRAKAINNALLVDKEEEYTQKQINFSGLDKVVRQLLEQVAAVVNTPVTKLLGSSPGGLGSSGAKEVRDYYDHVEGLRERDMCPQLDTLQPYLIRSATGNNSEVDYTFASLWQLDDSTRSAVFLQKTQALEILAATNLVNFKALSVGANNMLIEDGALPGFEDALDNIAETKRYPETNPALVGGDLSNIKPKSPYAKATPAGNASASVSG